MTQLRKDPVTCRWIVVNIDRPRGPQHYPSTDKTPSTKVCPFCPGNESHTPESIAEIRSKEAHSKHKWLLRVIPNKFPALKIEESTQKEAVGMYDKVGGFGAHEVIIENPEHHLEIADLSVDKVALILKTYKDRILDLKKDPRFKYILIFKNFGAEAGASLEHPHSQLIGLPIVPSRVQDELKGSSEHFDFCERCLFCDIIDQDESQKKLAVYQNEAFLSLCPYSSRFPFETWILPKKHNAEFESIEDDLIDDLADVVKNTLARLKKTLHNPSYNLMLHTIPVYSKNKESFHWHIEIIPHVTQIAGFELGTGFYINQTPPEIAAQALRNIDN